MANHGMDVGTPEDWVHESYKMQTWINVYSYKVNPVNDRHLWTKFECPTTLLPPKVHPHIGRPTKKRKKSKGEIKMVKGGKLTRKVKNNYLHSLQRYCMTRSSTKELFTPFKDPEREFRSSRKHFKTLSQFLKELRTNTFSGSDHEDANEHIERVLEIVDLFHIPNITIDQVMLRAFHMSLTGAASRWLRNKPSGSITTWEELKTKFLSKYCPPALTPKKMEEINNF
ncbi:hypothetical protein Tco_1554365 [Tanacetum coccineum]